MESSLNRNIPYQVSEVNIRDHGYVAGYHFAGNSMADFDSASNDIFLFCVKSGRINLHVSFIPHPLELNSGEAIFLANPRSAWKTKLQSELSAEVFVVRMEVSSFHKILNPAFDDHQLDASHRMNMKDLMRILPVGPSMMTCFDSLLHHKLKQPFAALFERAKFLEIFSQLLESSFGEPMDACPVAMSPAIENKLNLVRRHIIDHIDEAPDSDKLAILYALPRNTLKEGYKFVYGQTIHQFHSDYKLDSAMQMLNSGELLVKEVAFKIGYQNPSHFISAFKKKFGHTPKQYFKREIITQA
ncbi:MAG: AraC family transcriptional regulator [Saprospiraceae bacterium]